MGTSSTTSFSSSKPSLPTKTLVKHIKRRDWSACRSRLQQYPWDAHYVHSKEKTTPLHFVVVYRAPFEVVSTLLDANPSAITARNESGWTPIHLIVLHGSPDPQVALLLIQRGGNEACSVESPFSGSPLHLACFHGTSQDVLRAIVAANPSMVFRGAGSCVGGDSSGSSGDNIGPKPAEQLWHRFCRNPANRELLALFGGGSGSARKQMTTVHQVANLQEVLGQIRVLIDGYDMSMKGQTKTINDNTILPTNIPMTVQDSSYCDDQMAGATIADDAAAAGAIFYQILNYQPEIGDLNDFLHVAISAFPEGQLRFVDPESGNWLLHAACSRPSSSRRRTQAQSHSSSSSGRPRNVPNGAGSATPHCDTVDRDLIDVLIEAVPCAVGVKNKEGDYPLHLALIKGRKTWRSGISSLVKARSQLVQVRDRESGLFPFQAAAAVASSSFATQFISYIDDSSESEILETIFQLLLCCPHIITQDQTTK